MKKKFCNYFFIGILVVLFFAPSAFCRNNEAIEITPEELIKIQTNCYENLTGLKVMKAAINILQDDFYFIEDSDSQMGFIRATRELDIKDKHINTKQEFGCSKKFFGIKRLFPFFPSYARTEANINVTSENNKTIVRVTFRKKVFNLYDATIKTREVKDPNYYTNFYSKLDKALKAK